MRKTFIVIKREYLTRVKTKWFVIGTIAMPIFILAVTVIPGLLAMAKSERPQSFCVVAAAAGIVDELEEALDRKDAAGARVFRLERRVPGRAEDLAGVKEELSARVEKGDLDGFLVIPEAVIDENVVEFYAKNVTNFSLNMELEHAISKMIRNRRIIGAGLEPALVGRLTRGIELKAFRVGPGGTGQEEKGQTLIVAWIMAFCLYMVLVVYGQFVMRAVLEEKSSRVVELLVSSMKPVELMAGKILGVGGVGLTQFAIWAAAGVAITSQASAILGILGIQDVQIPAPEIGVPVFIFFVAFFVLGYLLYATMYAAVGAMINSEQEAQQAQFPIILLHIVPILTMGYIIGNPGSTAAVAMSLVPFFSPIIMFTRIAVEMPPAFEVALSLVLLVGTFALLVFLSARIFRVGILMYGKRPTLREILRWVRCP